MNNPDSSQFVALKEQEATYEPNESVKSVLSNKSLIMIVGPSAVGKSYIIDRLVMEGRHFGKVRSFSTREPRPDDVPSTMQSIPDSDVDDLIDRIKSGDVVSYMTFSATQHIYGTFADSYPAQYNLMPTMARSVATYQKLPFKQTTVVGVVTSPDNWKKWFNERSFASESERIGRLEEAYESVQWILDHPEVSIVVNHSDNILETTDMIADIVHRGTQHRDELAARALLEAIDQVRQPAQAAKEAPHARD